MKNHVIAAVLTSLLVIAAPIETRADELASPETTARIVRLLEGSGYRYSKLSSTRWSVLFKGKHKDSVEVLIIPQQDDLVMRSMITDHMRLDGNAPALRELLRANATLSARAAIVLNSDGDYVLQTRSPLSQLNEAAFKSAVMMVADGTDTVFGLVVQGAPPIGSTPANNANGTFVVPKTATQDIEILNGKAGVVIDPQVWKESKSSDAGRRTFRHVSGDGYAVVIAERLTMSMEQMPRMALSNARTADPNVKLVEQQTRNVNGTDVLLLRMEGTASGIPFTYLGYYYSGPAGTVQVMTYTGQNLFQEYRADFEAFLNGFHLK